MKVISRAAACGLLSALPAMPVGAQELSQSEASIVTTMGIGGAECSRWLFSERLEQAGNAWILGAWTGMNIMNGSGSRQVGNSLGSKAIVAAIKLRCQRSPSTPVSDIVMAFYTEVWRNGQ